MSQNYLGAKYPDISRLQGQKIQIKTLWSGKDASMTIYLSVQGGSRLNYFWVVQQHIMCNWIIYCK